MGLGSVKRFFDNSFFYGEDSGLYIIAAQNSRLVFDFISVLLAGYLKNQ
jgi:hypothetical protein